MTMKVYRLQMSKENMTYLKCRFLEYSAPKCAIMEKHRFKQDFAQDTKYNMIKQFMFICHVIAVTN